MTQKSHTPETILPILTAALCSARDQLEQFAASDKEGRDRDVRRALKEINKVIAEASKVDTPSVRHTPGPWQHDDQFIVAPDPEGAMWISISPRSPRMTKPGALRPPRRNKRMED